MTLSHIIKLRTNDGRRRHQTSSSTSCRTATKDFRICHRLQAAKLLTTYGNEDAPQLHRQTTPQTPSSNTRKRRPKRPTKFDTELARVIREDTNDGRSIARFLVNVMEGELTSFRPHHRMSAARELLDRGFGKSARKETPTPVVPAEAGTQRRQGREALTPGNPEPVEGPEPDPEPVHSNDTNKITVIPESDESQFRHPPVVPAESANPEDAGSGASHSSLLSTHS